VIAALLTAVPANAAASSWPPDDSVHIERDVGTLVSAPNTSGMHCKYYLRATTCFKASGDVFYVYDADADGLSAAGVWEEYYLLNGNSYLARQGVCKNNHGHGTWAKCDKDLNETDYIWMAPASLNSDWSIHDGAIDGIYASVA
jgi:hypothetical protein